MKQCVDRHDVTTGTVHWAPAFLDFAEHYGVLPVASPPYWPRVKGKVERGVGYIKRSFLEGRTLADLDDLNAQLTYWLATVANARVHGTTKAIPAVRFAEEQSVLGQARLVPVYDTRPIELRVAALDCHVSYRGVRYSVAPLAAGHTVTIRASGTPDVTLPAHAAAVRALTRGQSSAARRPGQHRPHFLQASVDRMPVETRAALDAIRRLAPVVETRTLAVYEAVA